MAGFSDILSAIQNGVIAVNNFGRQMTGSLNNIKSNLRIRLYTSTTFYVSNSGSNSNDGLSSSAPFLTIGYALSVLSSNYDVSEQQVIIQCADGTYNENITMPDILGAAKGGGLGSNNPSLRGNIATPSNCIINGSGSNATILVVDSAANDWIIRGFKLTNGGTGACIEADAGAWVRMGEMEYSSTGASTHLTVLFGATIEAMASYTISSSQATHLQTADYGMFVAVPGITVTLTGTPNFSICFTYATANALQEWPVSTTFSGAATGVRFINDTGSGLKTNGGGINFFPGNAPGTTTAPGWYT